MKLLLALASFRSKSADDFPDQRRNTPTFGAMFAELTILSKYSATMFEVVTMQSSKEANGTFLSLQQYDRAVSKLSHMLFAIFRASGSAFVPHQHYYNVQITCRGKYVSQAVSKAQGIDSYFPYQDADDREEQ
eukprot:3100796-Prymnesium_polylepis.1